MLSIPETQMGAFLERVDFSVVSAKLGISSDVSSPTSGPFAVRVPMCHSGNLACVRILSLGSQDTTMKDSSSNKNDLICFPSA